MGLEFYMTGARLVPQVDFVEMRNKVLTRIRGAGGYSSRHLAIVSITYGHIVGYHTGNVFGIHATASVVLQCACLLLAVKPFTAAGRKHLEAYG